MDGNVVSAINAEVSRYLVLSEDCYKIDLYDEAISYGKQCIDMAKMTGDKHAEMNACLVVGKAFSELEKYDEDICYGKRSIDIAKEISDKIAEMKAYLLIGKASSELEKYDDAVNYARMCLGIITDVEDSKDFEIEAYSLLGLIHFRLTEYEDAVIFYKVGLDLTGEKGDKLEEMSMLMSIATTYNLMKQSDEAVFYWKKFFEISRECSYEEDVVMNWFLFGNEFYNQIVHKDAILHYKKCLDNAMEHGDKESYKRVCLLIGSMHFKLHHYDNAVIYYKNCIDSAKASDDKDYEMMACLLLGKTHLKANQHDDSVIHYKKTIDIAKETGDKETEMKVCLQLAEIGRLLNQTDESVLHAKKALDIAKELGNKKTEMSAIMLLGTLHASLNQQSDADGCINELLAAGKESDPFSQFMFNTVALLQTDSLELANKIIKLSTESSSRSGKIPLFCQLPNYDIIFETLLMNHRMFMRILKSKDILKKHEMDALIKSCFNKTSRISLPNPSFLDDFEDKLQTKQPDNQALFLRIVLEPGRQLERIHQNIAPQIQSLRDMLLYCEDNLKCILLISVLYLESIASQAQCHFCIGMVNYILENKTNAKESFLESVRCFESMFDCLNVEKSKISIVDQYTDTYKMLSKMLLEEDQKEEALLISERCRAQTLKDFLLLKYGMKQDVSMEDGGHIQLTDIRSLVSINNFSILFYSLCVNDLHTFSLDGKNLHFSSQPLKISSTYDLEQYIDKAFSEMRVRQVVNCNNFSQDTETSQKIKETSAQSCFDLNYRVKTSGTSDESSLISALEVLYNKLLDKVPSEQDEIVIIPDGPLFNVPFAALRDPDTGRYLSEDKKIRIAPSLTTLKLLSKCPAEFNMMTGALVIGDSTVGRVKLNGAEMTVPPLKGARAEAIVIASNLGVTPLKEKEATKPAVIKKLQQGVSVVHIAAHGNLQKATILLAPSPETRESKDLPDEEDYMLTMADVQEAQVRAQLVVLSCCYSGRGEIRAEGVVGMCRAFLASGARAVVASLWAISDDATLDFMTYFYLHLKNGKSASTSLQMAMKVIRDDEEYSEPKYWAPFFLMGDDVTVSF